MRKRYTRGCSSTFGYITGSFGTSMHHDKIPFTYSIPHKESRKIANTRDVTSNHHNTLHHAKWPLKTSSLSLSQMNDTSCDTARKL